MYTVKLRNDQEEFYLHHPMDNTCILLDGTLTLELNKTGTFTFSISDRHPHISKIQKMRSEILIYQDEELIFLGRPLSETIDFYGTSQISCEGEMAYLLDSMQKPYSFQGSIYAFLMRLVQNHNALMETKKHFEVDKAHVYQADKQIQCEESAYANTLETLNKQLIDAYGGYLCVRHVGEKRYLDYVSLEKPSQETALHPQVIRFGENILDLMRYVKSDALITAIIPLGAEIKTDSENKSYVTIDSVNNGKAYLEDANAVQAFGKIFGTVEFKDVENPGELKELAKAYLKQKSNLSFTIELSAVDLHHLDMRMEKMQVGDWIRCVSYAHGLDDAFLLSQLSISLNDPGSSSISLGGVMDSFTNTAKRNQENVAKQVEQVNKRAANIETKMEIQDEILLEAKQITDKVETLTQKIQPDQLVVEVSKAINQGEKLDTTKVVIDQEGLTIEDGGLKIKDANQDLILFVDDETHHIVFKGDIRGSNIVTDKDLIVGNRLIIGDQQDNGFINYKSINFSDDVRLLGSKNEAGYWHLVMQALDRVTMMSAPVQGPTDRYASVSVEHDDIHLESSKSIDMKTQAITMNQQPSITSDARKKRNIDDIDVAWIDDLHIQQFAFLDTGRKEIGLIAQDYVDHPYRSYFLDEDEDGYYRIRYGNLWNALMKYCQQLKQRIDEMEEKYGKYS
ncbi:MAG: hypothetical protein HFF02_08635 [Erysipelotrichaceae bacterium]|nr:hypothetical protein [Erysipelotrichaceae bacterium]